MAPSTLARPVHSKADENKLDTDGSGSISGGNKIVNLSSTTKKISSKTGFLTSEASLTFIQLRKVFIKALILHHFDLERYIQIEIHALGYAISRVLSQLTSETSLVG